MERPAADETVRVAPVPEIAGLSDLAPIGRGGFADVFRAYQRAFDRDVAVKVLNRLDARIVELFQRECRSAGRLGWHDNVVSVYATGRTDDGRPYLCMEFLPHGSLAQSIGTGGELPWRRLRWEDVASIGVQLSSALGAAHRAGMLHRDVKPGNVLQEPMADGVRVKLSDFGIAGVLVDETPEHELTGTAYQFLSVGYAAPEALGRSQVVDHLSDLYSLGATMYVLLTGLPLTGRAVDLGAIGVPEPLVRLIDDLTDPIRSNRPPSASEVGARLQDLQRSSGLPVDRLTLERTAPVKARFDSSRTVRAAAQGMRRTPEPPPEGPPDEVHPADAADARADRPEGPDTPESPPAPAAEARRPPEPAPADVPPPVPVAATPPAPAEDLEDAMPTIEVSSLSSLIDAADEPAPARAEASAPAGSAAPAPSHPPAPAVVEGRVAPPADIDLDDDDAVDAAGSWAEGSSAADAAPDAGAGVVSTGDQAPHLEALPDDVRDAAPSDEVARDEVAGDDLPDPPPVAEWGHHAGFFERAPSDARWSARREPGTDPGEADEADDGWYDHDRDDAGDEPYDDDRRDQDDEPYEDDGELAAGLDRDEDRDDPDDGEEAAGLDRDEDRDDPDAASAAGPRTEHGNGSSPDAGYWGGPRRQQVYTGIGDVVQPDPPESWRRRAETRATSADHPLPTVSQRRTIGPEGVDRRSRWSGASGSTSDDAGGGHTVGRPVVPEWARPPADDEHPGPEVPEGRARVWDILITAIIVLIVVATIVTAGLLLLR